MTGYGQFCPVAKAAELLDQRWMLLVVRELMAGSQHFNEIRRGVPKMSPTLLSRRLRELVRAGVAERTDDKRYVLTPAGKELGPIVDALGAWGTRWVPELGDPDLDPHLLMWDIRRSIDLIALPPGRTVLHVVFRDVDPAERRWWLVMTRDGADLCDFDPGHDIAVTMETSLLELSRIWRGDMGWEQSQRTGELRLRGLASACRDLGRWLKFSRYATTPRTV
ncbi:HxlR family transcriptional regulator [Acrocarpospora phusangensis]|uniref:HxlR family transcriptional regulator n=1 Tax=Acrocarpospora phusangensis TaxID=1070424 RepID=A0A919QLC1_9ACTN|nr:helix-turn-helix domain-containing protein [Acrocarpospora phusangensis]GIH29595.1 HxlR family transcriptional regulator [Acrocarpospora phusangensis]